MERWLKAALDYIQRWPEVQMRAPEHPGLAVAICQQQKAVLGLALGHTDLASKAPRQLQRRSHLALGGWILRRGGAPGARRGRPREGSVVGWLAQSPRGAVAREMR